MCRCARRTAWIPTTDMYLFLLSGYKSLHKYLCTYFETVFKKRDSRDWVEDGDGDGVEQYPELDKQIGRVLLQHYHRLQQSVSFHFSPGLHGSATWSMGKMNWSRTSSGLSMCFILVVKTTYLLIVIIVIIIVIGASKVIPMDQLKENISNLSTRNPQTFICPNRPESTRTRQRTYKNKRGTTKKITQLLEHILP